MTEATTETIRAGIADEHRVEEYGSAAYGRPRFRLRYYSQDINSRAFKTFSTRHEAVGVLAILERDGRCDHARIGPSISYEESY